MNPFLFRAFKIAIAKLLAGLEPAGKMVSPMIAIGEALKKQAKGDRFEKQQIQTADEMIETWGSPQQVAATATKRTLSDLYRGPGWAPDDVRAFWADDVTNDPNLMPFAQREVEVLAERVFYGMASARNDLNLTKPRKSVSKKS